jgi:tetratricopeptide (TPR) repeat protein
VNRRRRLWLYLTILGAVAAAGAGGALAFRVLTGTPLVTGLGFLLRPPDRALGAVLESADQEIARGYPSRAEAALEEGYRRARGELEMLRLLRRERHLAEMSGSYGRLARRARQAWEELPGSRRLAELAAYATLRGEHPEEAATVLSRTSRFAELDGLRSEAFLEGWLTEPKLSGSAQERLRTLVELPRLGDPAAMHSLADLLEEPRLDLDAALLWMRRGEPEEAFAALRPRREERSMVEPLAFMAIDAGRYADAWELLGSEPASGRSAERLVLRGDLAWLLGRPEQAAEMYQEAIQLEPGYSWIPYLNLAALLEEGGDRKGARDFRRRAHALFPDRAEVVLAHARDLAGTGARAQARELVEALVEKDPSQLSAQLLSLELAGARGSPAVFRGRMWELLNRHPDDPDLVRTFALYLVSMRDLAGAEAVLSQYEQAREGAVPPWFQELRGVVVLAGGDATEAVRLLHESVTAAPGWRRRFNLALALMAANRDEEAVGELMQSESELSAAGVRMAGKQAESYRSRIRSRIAEAQLRLGDADGARREALYALDLDQGNQHARRVLRILDGIR